MGPARTPEYTIGCYMYGQRLFLFKHWDGSKTSNCGIQYALKLPNPVDTFICVHIFYRNVAHTMDLFRVPLVTGN